MDSDIVNVLCRNWNWWTQMVVLTCISTAHMTKRNINYSRLHVTTLGISSKNIRVIKLIFWPIRQGPWVYKLPYDKPLYNKYTLTAPTKTWLALATDHTANLTRRPSQTTKDVHQTCCIWVATKPAAIFEINSSLLKYDIWWNISPTKLSHWTTYICWFS